MLPLFISALIAGASAAVHTPAHGYAEVCVPAFAEKVTPVTLAVKEVVDNGYCFDRVLTICEETSTVVEREICTYVYEREDVTAPCTTTQVTYDQKSETMKV